MSLPAAPAGKGAGTTTGAKRGYAAVQEFVEPGLRGNGRYIR